jgi:hypothetical protein
MKKYIGWLFDLYAHPVAGIVLWLVDESGKAHRFHQGFESVFYTYGSVQRLHELGKHIRLKHPRQEVRLERVTKEDLFAGPRVLMGIGIYGAAL